MKIPGVFNQEGEPLPCTVVPQPGQSLAKWLALNGYPLNTRCGGRELCKGCHLRVGQDGKTVRGCKTPVDDINLVVIPRASLHDRSLTGVSVFVLDPAVLPEENEVTMGFALDIGTTTLAATLWNGKPARCLAAVTSANPQIPYGDNVVSRIQLASEQADGDALLHRVLIEEGIGPLLESLCKNAGVEQKDLTCGMVTGNPAMLHSLAGESLKGLATYPFRPVFLETRNLPGTCLGLSPDVPVRLLRSLGPFVGSDISAGALASGIYHREGPELLIDFGTNGEILLHADGKTLCTATAAGPAFEGGRLSHGASAGEGVVSGLQSCQNKRFEITGPGAPYHGMAGAAYVDFLALGTAAGLISETGRFSEKGLIEPVAGVQISEADVAELLQAKAAIQAGWTTLLAVAGIRMRDLKRVTVAGGFGYHLNPVHAMAIGLLPDLPADRIRAVGNASLAGACLGLLAPERMQRLDQICEEAQCIELNQIPGFEDFYIDAMILAPAEQYL